MHLHVQPRASATELAGLFGAALKVRVASPPVAGAANLALVRFLAELLEVPRASVKLASGLGSRRKTVTVQGITLAQARARLGL